MRCTLLNSLERHLCALCRGLTSLYELEKHQTRSLIWQRLWLMTLVKEWEERTKEKESSPCMSFFISALWTMEGCTITSAVDICSHPRLLWICQLSLPPPPLLSIYLGASIKAVFCSRGSYGVSGLCHSPSSIMDQHREQRGQRGQSFWVFFNKEMSSSLVL